MTQDQWTIADLVSQGFLSRGMAELLEAAVKARLNIVVGGPAGSGKTTLLNALRGLFQPDERVAFIEQGAQAQTQVNEAIAARSERIVVDEVRGPEALDMLQAMSNGGWLAAIEARWVRDAAKLLEWMALNANLEDRALNIRRLIGGGVHFFVQVAHYSDGSRRVANVTEVTGLSGETLTLLDIFVFEKRSITPEGLVRGRFKATGIRPKAYYQLQTAGIKLDRELFEEVQEV